MTLIFLTDDEREAMLDATTDGDGQAALAPLVGKVVLVRHTHERSRPYRAHDGSTEYEPTDDTIEVEVQGVLGYQQDLRPGLSHFEPGVGRTNRLMVLVDYEIDGEPTDDAYPDGPYDVLAVDDQ